MPDSEIDYSDIPPLDETGPDAADVQAAEQELEAIRASTSQTVPLEEVTIANRGHARRPS